MAAIFGGTNFFLKTGSLSRITLWIKNFAEIALPSTVFEIKAFLKKKMENSKWLPLLESEIFVETWKG